MNAIILCGGLSTRLGDITKDIPKALLDIGDRALIDWQLEKLNKMGIDEVVLAAGHLANVLKEMVGERRAGCKLIYAIEKERLGTGGAIKHALGFVRHKDKPTIVLNGDILTTADFAAMAGELKSDSDGIILGVRVDNAASYGTLEYDDSHHLTAFREKEGKHESGYINGGVYMFTPQIQKQFPDETTFSVEYDVFPAKDLYVYESDAPWIDIGIPERLAWAREHWETFKDA